MIDSEITFEYEGQSLDFIYDRDDDDGFEVVKDPEPEPKTNEGREECFWCGKRTAKKLLLYSATDFCDNCQK